MNEQRLDHRFAPQARQLLARDGSQIVRQEAGQQTAERRPTPRVNPPAGDDDPHLAQERPFLQTRGGGDDEHQKRKHSQEQHQDPAEVRTGE